MSFSVRGIRTLLLALGFAVIALAGRSLFLDALGGNTASLLYRDWGLRVFGLVGIAMSGLDISPGQGEKSRRIDAVAVLSCTGSFVPYIMFAHRDPMSFVLFAPLAVALCVTLYHRHAPVPPRFAPTWLWCQRRSFPFVLLAQIPGSRYGPYGFGAHLLDSFHATKGVMFDAGIACVVGYLVLCLVDDAVSRRTVGAFEMYFGWSIALMWPLIA